MCSTTLNQAVGGLVKALPPSPVPTPVSLGNPGPFVTPPKSSPSIGNAGAFPPPAPPPPKPPLPPVVNIVGDLPKNTTSSVQGVPNIGGGTLTNDTVIFDPIENRVRQPGEGFPINPDTPGGKAAIEAKKKNLLSAPPVMDVSGIQKKKKLKNTEVIQYSIAKRLGFADSPTSTAQSLAPVLSGHIKPKLGV